MGILHKKEKPVPKAVSVGVVGMQQASGQIREEFLDKLQWPQAGKIYQEMASNDAVIGASLYLIETLVRGVNWKVTPASTETADVEAADFLQSCMNDMEESWADFICEALSMLTYGFSFHEVVYKIRRGPLEKNPKYYSRYTDGKIGWRSLRPRSQATLSEWRIDDATGNTLAFVQDPSMVGINHPPVDIPLKGNLLLRTTSRRNNPEGESLLRHCYRSWYFKRYIEELEGIGIERSLAGIPVLQPDAETPLFDKTNPAMKELLYWAQQLVNGIRQDSNHGVIIPANWKLSLLAPEGHANIDTNVVITRHETRMAMALLSDLVLLGSTGSGSFALAEVKQNMLTRSVTTIIASICACLNTQLVPSLFALNGIQLVEYPKIDTDTLMPPSLKEVALLLRSAGLDITSNLELYNTFMHLLNAPQASTEEDMAQLAGKVSTGQSQDTVDNDNKMSDMSYT